MYRSSEVSSNPNPHPSYERKISCCDREPIYVALIILGVVGIGVVGGIGLASFGASQSWWSISTSLSQLGQVKALVLMAGGGGGFLLLVIGAVGSVRSYYKSKYCNEFQRSRRQSQDHANEVRRLQARVRELEGGNRRLRDRVRLVEGQMREEQKAKVEQSKRAQLFEEQVRQNDQELLNVNLKKSRLESELRKNEEALVRLQSEHEGTHHTELLKLREELKGANSAKERLEKEKRQILEEKNRFEEEIRCLTEEAEEVRERLSEELEKEKKTLLELQKKLEKTGRVEIGEKCNYKGKLIFKEKRWFEFFKKKCAELKIPSRHIMFYEDEMTCYVSSYKILLFIGLRNDKYSKLFSRLTGFSDFSRNPEIGRVINLRNKSEWVKNQPYKEENYVTTQGAQKEFFDQLTPKPHPLTLSQEEPITDKILISAIYKDYSGAVIGERHCDIHSKKFIIDNIHILKQNGVEAIYLEHLYYDVMQEDLDAYFSGEEEEMPSILEGCLDCLDNGQDVPKKCVEKYGFKALVREAKKAGIRVIAIDTEKSYESGTDAKYAVIKDEDRARAMNHQASIIIDLEEKKAKKKLKFIALVGSFHVCKTKGVYGLSEILGCPNVVIYDDKDTTERITLAQPLIINRKQLTDGIVDVFIERPYSNL